MKQNSKQIQWANNQVNRYHSRKAFGLLATVMCLFLVVIAISFVMGDASLYEFLGTGAVSLATVAPAAININGNPANTAKAGKLVKAKLWFIVEEQYDDTQAFPSRSGREVGNIPLKSGEYWHYMKTVSISNPEATIGGNLGDIGGTLTNTVKAVFGGVDDDLMTLIEDHMGKGFYIVFEVCENSKKYLIGNGCKPAILQAPEGGFGKDNSSLSLTWTQECGELFSTYVGNTPTENPVEIGAAAITIALTANPQFQFATGTASTEFANVTAITDSDVNRIVTFIGGGGTGPSKIVDGGNILLIGGQDWVANTSAQISFKIFKDAAATYKLIEIAGTRT